MADAPIDLTAAEEGGEEFPRLVRAALLNLYDNAFLQSHPLTAAWAAGDQGDRLSQAQELRRTLLDCIERLRPHTAAHGDAARVYAVLTYRCIDGLTIEEIEQKLALSRRQIYREFTKGVDAVAEQLLDLLKPRIAAIRQTPEESAPTVSRRELAQAELARLSKAAHIDAVALHTVVGGVCRLLDARLQQRCISVEISLSDSAPPVLADRTLLRQALLNLLSYALDVLPDGGMLSIASTEQNGAVHLYMRQLASVMAGTGATPAQRREGVALTVAQSLIQAQNGRLTLGETADGWCAEITLPTAQAPSVLIIDDNQNLIDLFQRYLAGHRIKVIGAVTGNDALAAVRQNPPQVIVLDVMMPHQDGWEILQQLRDEPASAAVPIIICSVLREHDLALSLGASDTIVKPVSQPVLLDVMRRWLGTLHPLE